MEHQKIIIGAKEEPLRELRVELEAQDETAASAEIFNDLRLERDQHPAKALFEGRW